MPDALLLSDRLDHATTAALHADLQARRGTALEVDGRKVTFLGTLAAQLLVSAKKTWAQDGLAFHITPSEDMAAQVDGLGLGEELLDGEAPR